MYLQVLPAEFHLAVTLACNESELIRKNVYAYTIKEYAGFRCFLHPSWECGFAIGPDGALVSVFSLVRCKGREILPTAVREGALHLNCYEGYLVTLYQKYGFKEYKREASWTPGEPDVVFMRR